MVGWIKVYLSHLASKNKLMAHPNVELNQIYEKSVHCINTSYGILRFGGAPGDNLINLLGTNLGAQLSQVNRVRCLNKCLKVL